jgi:hypothetical protein
MIRIEAKCIIEYSTEQKKHKKYGIERMMQNASICRIMQQWRFASCWTSLSNTEIEAGGRF